MRPPTTLSFLSILLVLESGCIQTKRVEGSHLIDKRLYQAVEESRKDDIKRALREGADIHSRAGYESRTPLHFARTAEIAQLLLAEGAKPNLQDDDGRTPLYLAVMNGRHKVASVLLKRGADPNIQRGPPGMGPQGGPLHCAARDDTDLAKLLLDYGADPNLKTDLAHSPLYEAAYTNNRESCELLLNRKADVLSEIVDGHTPWFASLRHGSELASIFVEHLSKEKGIEAVPLHWWCSVGRVDKVAELLRLGADVNARLDYNCTPLAIAARCGQADVCKVLLDSGADPNITEKYGSTALMGAAATGKARIVAMLLERGANQLSTKYSKVTALHRAATTDICKLLIEKGADIQATTQNGETPLLSAAGLGRWAVVDFLVARGSDLNATDNSGHSALYYAMLTNEEEVIVALLEKGATISGTRMWDGKNILHRAVERKYMDILTRLLKQGNSPNMIDNDGKTPLHIAAYHDHEIAKCLLRNGADPNIRNKRGFTPLHVAVLHGNVENVRLLLANGADPTLPPKQGQSVRPWRSQRWNEIRSLLEESLGGRPVPSHFRREYGVNPQFRSAQ
jgi:ankyrin repeat domain-containing protein 50